MNKYIKKDINKHSIIKKLLKENAVDAILIYNPKNRLWFSEFKSTEGYLLISNNKAYLYVDGRYITAAGKIAKNVDKIIQFGNIFELLNKDLKFLNIKKLGFESDFLSFANYELYSKSLNSKLCPVNTSKIRTIKNNQEISFIHKACQISDIAFSNVVKNIKVGMTELEIDSIIFSSFMQEGADEPSFPSIVASGIRGAMPHGRASSKKIQNNELVTIDFGCYYKGYASDITRTIALGKPKKELLEIYEIVKKSQMMGINAIKPGISTKDIDSICRDYIISKGYGDYFIHSTGHGLGADVHEFPRVSPYCDIKLETGMVITVEPGIYIPNLGGVRIEDDILVTDNGYKVLTQSKKNPIVLIS